MPEPRRPRTVVWLIAATLGAALLLGGGFGLISMIVAGDTEVSTTTTPGATTTVVVVPDLPAVPTSALPALTGAPDFSVTLFDGTAFRLSTHLAEDGRPVFLNLWASWCGPCRAEMPDLDSAAARHPGVLFLGVAVDDSPEAAAAFAAEIGVTYPLGADDRSVADAYPAFGLPATYLIDASGELAATVFGQVGPAEIDGLVADHFDPPGS